MNAQLNQVMSSFVQVDGLIWSRKCIHQAVLSNRRDTKSRVEMGVS